MAEVVYSLGALGEQLREVSMVSELDMLFSIVNGRAPPAPLAHPPKGGHLARPPKPGAGQAALSRSQSAREVRPSTQHTCLCCTGEHLLVWLLRPRAHASCPGPALQCVFTLGDSVWCLAGMSAWQCGASSRKHQAEQASGMWAGREGNVPRKFLCGAPDWALGARAGPPGAAARRAARAPGGHRRALQPHPQPPERQPGRPAHAPLARPARPVPPPGAPLRQCAALKPPAPARPRRLPGLPHGRRRSLLATDGPRVAEPLQPALRSSLPARIVLRISASEAGCLSSAAVTPDGCEVTDPAPSLSRACPVRTAVQAAPSSRVFPLQR